MDNTAKKAPMYDVVERVRLYSECPVIQAQLPIKLTNGMVWDSITGVCAKCSNHIDPDMFRGEVHRVFTDVYKIRAVGLCPHCNLITCFAWTINKQGIAGRNADGEYVLWTPTTQRSLISRILRLIFRILFGR